MQNAYSSIAFSKAKQQTGLTNRIVFVRISEVSDWVSFYLLDLSLSNPVIVSMLTTLNNTTMSHNIAQSHQSIVEEHVSAYEEM